MDSFEGKIAVVTGGGSGMGRELVRQLAREGCHVGTCDIWPEDLAQTARLALEDAPAGTRVTTFTGDVSDEDQVLAFRDAVVADHDATCVDLIFNNAGVSAGYSLIASPRAEWDRTFQIDWGGVYYCTRAFLPLLLASDEGHVVNTSSMNGFHAHRAPEGLPSTAYSTAKFAVKGFTEALITDFAVHAPHLHAHVVMPGRVDTSIKLNTIRAHVSAVAEGHETEAGWSILKAMGIPAEAYGQNLDLALKAAEHGNRDASLTSAASAVTTILDAVRADRWRILVGEDAHAVDELVRADPESAYTDEFQREVSAQIQSRRKQ